MKTTTFASAEEFLQAFDYQQPGCIILDVCMPGIDGLALQERLAIQPLHPSVIMMTSFPEVPTAVRSIQQGAVEYLAKTCPAADLQQAVEQAIGQDAKRRMHAERRSEVESALAQLSPPEKDVLRLVVAGKPNKSIASALNVSRRAVEDRRARIMRKVGAGSLPDLVRFAIQAGFSPPN
jgi:RNA polymerase sigma factor (sigma-70 family)